MLVPISKDVIPSGRPSRGMGELPSNVVRACMEWDPSMQVDPDGYLWRNGQPLGVKQCQNGVAPVDAVMTVISMDGALRSLFQDLRRTSDEIASREAQLQGLCRRAQDMEEGAGYRIPRPMAPFLDLWNEAQGVLATAGSAVEAANVAWAAIWQWDSQADFAYTRGVYRDQTLGREIIFALQAWNHVPMAWENCQVAAACVKEGLDYWISVCWNEADQRFATMSNIAQGVAATYDEVQTFLAALQADAARVTLSQQAADSIAAAKPSLDALNELAGQIGVLYQGATVQHDAALKGTTDGAPVATEWARYWLEENFPPFWGAIDKAGELAADIHAKLDGTALELRRYIAEHPELLEEPKKGGGKGVLVLGGVALAALVLKKAALFA